MTNTLIMAKKYGRNDGLMDTVAMSLLRLANRDPCSEEASATDIPPRDFQPWRRILRSWSFRPSRPGIIATGSQHHYARYVGRQHDAADGEESGHLDVAGNQGLAAWRGGTSC